MSALPQISEAEYEVMKIVWKYAPINTNEITEKLLATSSWSAKTIQTLIKRLVNKGVLTYEKDSRVFRQRPRIAGHGGHPGRPCPEKSGHGLLQRNKIPRQHHRLPAGGIPVRHPRQAAFCPDRGGLRALRRRRGGVSRVLPGRRAGQVLRKPSPNVSPFSGETFFIS